MSRNRLEDRLRTGDIWPAIRDELTAAGAAYRLEMGGRHAIVRISLDGVERRLPVPTTPGSYTNGRKRALCQLRRLMAEMRIDSQVAGSASANRGNGRTRR